jgi:hypothetical protein
MVQTYHIKSGHLYLEPASEICYNLLLKLLSRANQTHALASLQLRRPPEDASIDEIVFTFQFP